MSIEKRAEEYADNYVVGDAAIIADLMHKVAKDAYIQGAIEQREVDIDKACEWFLSQIDYDNSGRECRVFFRDSVERFRKAMEGVI